MKKLSTIITLATCLLYSCLLATVQKPTVVAGGTISLTNYEPLGFLEYLKQKPSKIVFPEKQVIACVDKDTAKALEYYRRAANLGSVCGILNYCSMIKKES